MQDSNTPKASLLKRKLFHAYSKPFFRTCEIICNHAARIFMKHSSLENTAVRGELEKLNSARMEYQRVLNEIGGSHIHVCAECKGKCCGGERERDAFTDRILQNPDSEHLHARRKTGNMAAYDVVAKQGAAIPTDAECVKGFCPELTVKGCRIPYELRPIQCTAYFCGPTTKELSSAECDRGITALAGLMRVQMKTVMLALTSRFK